MKSTKHKGKIRISYNAPVTLTFSLLCTLILLLDTTIIPHLVSALFVVAGSQSSPTPFNPYNALDYLRLFTHVLGHVDWQHLVSNLSLILLLGPLLEERYGSSLLFLMIVTTAFATGVINATLIPAGLTGASGIAFMMILLSSFTSFDRSSIPLTFILILFLYIGNELLISGNSDDVANWAHIVGGVVGSLFGFIASPVKTKRTSKTKTNDTKKSGYLSKGEEPTLYL